MKPTKINKEMLEGFEAKTRIFGQHGRGINISIDMHTDPTNKAVWFTFNDSRCQMYAGPSLEEAISYYNSVIREHTI
jgi:hypothetical protein